MTDLAGLVNERTQQRVDDGPIERTLSIGTLEVGDVGVLRVEVRAVGTVKTFTSKSGRAGMLRRVALGDRTGEVDLVLWGDETQQATDGPFEAGKHVMLRGATVKAGFQGGIEVQLGGAIVEPVEHATETVTLEGVIESMGDTSISGTPPNVRFQAETTLSTAAGPVQVLLWDDCVKAVRSVLPGASIRIEGATAHPALEGWFVADGARVVHV